MFERAKAFIKSVPPAYWLLLPVISLLRWYRRFLYQRRLRRFRLLCKELPEVIPEPVFVKVGANDGMTGDPCSDMLLRNGRWKGLLVEPVPYCFKRLREHFTDTERFSIEQVAIGATVGKSTFYYVDTEAQKRLPGLPTWYDQLGSFNRKHITSHLGGVLEPFIVECTVEVYPLSYILKRNGIRNPDLLHVDTEGYDYEVLRTLDFVNHAPFMIFVEHTHLGIEEKEGMLCLLRKNGYTVKDCGSDYFAVNKEASKRLQRLKRAADRVAI